MLATGTFIFGTALAGSSVPDRLMSMGVPSVEKRRADVTVTTEENTKEYTNTAACEVGDLGWPALPLVTMLEEGEVSVEASVFDNHINGLTLTDRDPMAADCRSCVQTCLDELAMSTVDDWGDSELVWRDADSTPTPDWQMMSCSLRCGERTVEAKCDLNEYVRARWLAGNASEKWTNKVSPFAEFSFSTECDTCASKCANIIIDLSRHDAASTETKDVDDMSADEMLASFELLELALQASNEYNTCISCCAGFETSTVEDAYPKDKTCATAEFGAFDYSGGNRAKSEGKTLTSMQLAGILGGVAIVVCLLLSCVSYFCCCKPRK